MTTYGTIPTSSGGTTTTNIEYLSRAKHRIKTGLGTRRPWKEMLNLASINFPHNITDSYSRIKTNTAYFRMNYAIIVLIILFLSLLWHPISLIVFVVLMAAWLFLYFLRDEPLMIFHRVVDDRVVMTVLFVVTVVLLLLTGATVNILVAMLIGLVVVVVHAVLRRTDDLFLDEDGVEAGGYLVASS
ncbi:putative prenylated rab acceptor P [Helianthus anomalus]